MITALQGFRTYHLAIELNEACARLNLDSWLKDQLSRASRGIILTLAEGSAKSTAKDRARYYNMALGSFREVQAILQLAEQPSLIHRFDHLGACLYKLSHHP